MIARLPSATAWVTAMVMPRSLKEPVGLRPSYLMYMSTSLPRMPGMFSSRISGVSPSPRLMMRVLSVTGMRAR